MELEQRVKVLEQEVKILKNQIQTTLLDIQEQLLVSKYPALRTEDDFAAPATQEYQPAPAVEPSAPIIHKVTLTDNPPREETPQMDLPVGVEMPPAQSGTDWNDLARMNEWAATTVEKVGVERAQMLIMMYARRGLLTAEVEEALLEAVELYAAPYTGEPAPVKPTNGRRHEEPPAPAQPVVPIEEQDLFAPEEDLEEPKVERNLIMRLIKGLQGGNREVNRG